MGIKDKLLTWMSACDYIIKLKPKNMLERIVSFLFKQSWFIIRNNSRIDK